MGILPHLPVIPDDFLSDIRDSPEGSVKSLQHLNHLVELSLQRKKKDIPDVLWSYFLTPIMDHTNVLVDCFIWVWQYGMALPIGLDHRIREWQRPLDPQATG